MVHELWPLRQRIINRAPGAEFPVLAILALLAAFPSLPFPSSQLLVSDVGSHSTAQRRIRIPSSRRC